MVIVPVDGDEREADVSISSPGISFLSAARSVPAGGRSSSTMIVMITAITPSLKPSRRVELSSGGGGAEDSLFSMALHRFAVRVRAIRNQSGRAQGQYLARMVLTCALDRGYWPV